MSWNGSGIFNRLYSWTADKAAGLNIIASRMDTDTDDITGNGFSNCLTRDGQGFATANLPMAGFRHTNVGTGVARTDYAALGQMQDGSPNWTIWGGAADAITATYTPAITALIDGQLCFGRALLANATTTPTFAPNGLTAHTITKLGGSALSIGDIAGALAEAILRYNLANTRWELLNPSGAGIIVPIGALIPFTGLTLPNANFVFPYGQSVLRADYPAYFTLVGTRYGSADGTHFNFPNLSGTIIACMDTLPGGVAANKITTAGSGVDGTTAGATGGSQSVNVSIAQANLPSVAFTVSGIAVTSSQYRTGTTAQAGAGSHSLVDIDAGVTTVADTVTSQGTAASGGSGTAINTNNMPPAFVLPYLLRVL